MLALRVSMTNEHMVPHCCPSDREEVQKFMFLPDECMQQLLPLDNDDSEMYNFYKCNWSLKENINKTHAIPA